MNGAAVLGLGENYSVWLPVSGGGGLERWFTRRHGETERRKIDTGPQTCARHFLCSVSPCLRVRIPWRWDAATEERKPGNLVAEWREYFNTLGRFYGCAAASPGWVLLQAV